MFSVLVLRSVQNRDISLRHISLALPEKVFILINFMSHGDQGSRPEKLQ